MYAFKDICGYISVCFPALSTNTNKDCLKIQDLEIQFSTVKIGI